MTALCPGLASRSPGSALRNLLGCHVGKPPENWQATRHDRAMSTTMSYYIRPIEAAHLDAVRSSGLDASGTPVVRLIDAVGEPMRCCLRDALPGEECILFGYEAPIPGEASPYREIGAVLAHAYPCGGPSDLGSYPEDWYGRPQVLRAYDARGWIHPATTTHDGSTPV
jgi:hypothetical protein